MSSTPTEKSTQPNRDSHLSGERLVYVMPEQAYSGDRGDDFDLRELWNILWRGKWIIAVVTAVFAIASIAYALSQTHWYRAEVLLAPAEARSVPSLAGQLGGLAALAGVSVGGEGDMEALATLRSRDFAREFIEDFDLLPVFFADAWDGNLDQWRDPDPAKWPDSRDAVRFFHKNILNVQEDRYSSLVTLSVEWTDSQVAADWALALVRRLNARLRERALLEAESNVAYLQAELAQTNVVTLQQSIGRLLESELQKLMLARGNEEFAFRIIDGAEAPKIPSRPRRTLIVAVATLFGGMIAVFGVFVWHAMRRDSNRTIRA